MSNFVKDLEDDESTIVSHSSIGSPAENGGDHPTITTSRKKRNLPDPEAEVVALSPRTLMATNRYTCEVCHKGFQRDQNLQLHRRGHNLPWKLKERPTAEVKKRVFICPEQSCVHHHPSRALGDLTGIKKHFCRKHGEKKWKCDKCSKRYAVQCDWKAHAKICGTREYRCDCGTMFSRKDSFVTHRAFCDALAEESYKVSQNLAQGMFSSSMPSSNFSTRMSTMMNLSISNEEEHVMPIFNQRLQPISSSFTSATALLQKAAEMGAKISDNSITPILLKGFSGYSASNMNMNTPGHVEPISATSNGLYLGDQTTFHRNFNNGGQGGFDLLSEEAVLVGGREKTTVDFLGVEPTEHSNIGKKRSFDGNIIGLAYSNPHQTLHNMW